MPPTPAPVPGLLQPSLGPCCCHRVVLFGLSSSPLVLWEVSFFGISCFLFLHLFDVGREKKKKKKALQTAQAKSEIAFRLRFVCPRTAQSAPLAAGGELKSSEVLLWPV